MLGYHRPSKGIRLSGSHTEAQHSPVPSATAERQTKGCGTAKKWAECEIKGRWGCKGVVKALGAFMESGQSSRHPPWRGERWPELRVVNGPSPSVHFEMFIFCTRYAGLINSVSATALRLKSGCQNASSFSKFWTRLSTLLLSGHLRMVALRSSTVWS